MDYQTILVSLITSCIPALIAYLTASKQSKNQLEQLDKNNQAELEKMKLEYELKLKEKTNDTQNDFVMKMLSGDLKTEGSLDALHDLAKLAEEADKLQNLGFLKNKK